MTVYADVLVVVNYIVNLLLLLASAKLLGVVTCRWRLCAGALVGALG
ncbi:sigma-E processing peptidase SpoIIGA, partial [Anaerotruncus massiliensis (ex Liu et al. 2021)]